MTFMLLFSSAGLYTRTAKTKLAELDARHWPDTMGSIVVVNAPLLFTAILNVVLSFLPTETQAKVKVFGDPNFATADMGPGADAASFLCDLCGPGALPAELGGSLPPGSAPYDL